MKSVHEVIEQNRIFIGRKKQLAAMKRMRDSAKEQWGILHFFGVAGIGKTALFHQFAQLNERVPVVYVHRLLQMFAVG